MYIISKKMKRSLFRGKKLPQIKIDLPDPGKPFIIREGEERKLKIPGPFEKPEVNRPLIRGIPDKPDIPPPPPPQTIIPE
jgi:hypothetical protein